ncbi:nitrate- and nitrite sensing domain-containing protein [Mariprofundus sp. KV]|uniref:nitrate- and nitrite sensing domain-containing protein n=1 Tax=Mariprofundus sp. KV TaxID=2608715 RepID=UPI00159F96FC|nr:nitrate- and nitrite sensing domain-containing protein [Mariprofundus sp. KV]NWF36579.1 HAMP domain-containing protein [Mariprofundus sp. KV]
MNSVTFKPASLSIKNRVILIVTLFVLMLLAFTVYHFSQRWDELTRISRSQDAFEITRQVNLLVYGLEKEFALSSRFLASSKEPLRIDMVKQRQKSDIDIERLAALLFSYRQQWQSSVRLSDIKSMEASLEQIVVQRSAGMQGAFDSHSDNTESLIQQAGDITGMSISAELRDSFDAYMKLLWLLQRLGQERGITYEMIERTVFAASDLLKVDNYISRQSELIGQFKRVADSRFVTMLNARLDDPVVRHAEQLRAALKEQVQLNDLLNRLHATVGYGGLIHAFKNYVIRGDSYYEQLFHEKMKLFKQLSDDIKRLKLGGEIADQVAIIESTVELYRGHIDTVTQMRKKGRSIAEIDRRVRVDDRPALAAIEFLRSHITRIDAEDWWRSTTWRLDQVFEVAGVLEQEIHRDIELQMQAAYRSMLYYLILSLLLLIITLYSAYYLIRHVAGSLTAMAEALHSSGHQKDYKPFMNEFRGDEIGQLARAFNRLIGERQQSETQLLHLSEKSRHLSRRLITAAEDERSYIARELHDELGQPLTAVKTIATLLAKQSTDPQVIADAGEIKLMIDRLFRNVRRILKRIRPDMLDASNLQDGLLEVIKQWQKNNNIACSFNCSGALNQLPDMVKVATYRLIQESLTNISRHASASSVTIDVAVIRDADAGPLLKLDVQDDGIGADVSSLDMMGLGMIGIHERVRSLNGKCDFISAPGKGMHIAVSIPFSHGREVEQEDLSNQTMEIFQSGKKGSSK